MSGKLQVQVVVLPCSDWVVVRAPSLLKNQAAALFPSVRVSGGAERVSCQDKNPAKAWRSLNEQEEFEDGQ
jgi:hypothetical protein